MNSPHPLAAHHVPNALVLLAEGFEEIETVVPIDLLRRAGVQVTIAALGPFLPVLGRCQMTLQADALLDDVWPGVPHWDIVVVPGGPGVARLRADLRVRAIVQQQAAAQRPLGAICAAPTVLLDAGVLPLAYTAHPSVAHELPAIQTDAAVVQVGSTVTSRGAGTALEFGLALVGLVAGPAKMREIAASLCFQGTLPEVR